MFDTIKTNVQVKHSQDMDTEDTSELILNGTLMLGSHEYTSNWLMASSRNDVLLGMPWHVANNPEIDYTNRVVKVGSDVFPAYFHEEKCSKCASNQPKSQELHKNGQEKGKLKRFPSVSNGTCELIPQIDKQWEWKLES